MRSLGDMARQMTSLQKLVVSQNDQEGVDEVVYEKAYESTAGADSIGRSIYNEEDGSVMILSLPEGTELPPHTHENPIVEYGIILKGSIRITQEGVDDVIYSYQDCVILKDEVMHSGVALEDTKIIAITIPQELGYPGA